MNRMKKSVIVALLAALCAAAWAASQEELLLQAAQNRDMDKLQSALNQGADVNCTDADGFSALLHACKKEWDEGVAYLLGKDVDVDVGNKNGKTALMYAVSHWNMTNARRLIDKGANINAKDFEGKTALMYAIESNNDRAADFLLRQGADCLATDSYGNTVAMYAVRYKSRALLRELVKNPLIDWNKTNNDDVSPFALACMDGDLNIINRLLQEAPIEISDSRIDGMPIIVWLISHRKSAIVIEYLVEFCNPREIRSMIDDEGHDIKYWAEKQGYKNILIRLDEIEEKESRRNRAYSKQLRNF